MKNKNKRLLSVDALRGFDMFFISGGISFLYLLEGKTEWPLVDMLAKQMKHPAWEGFTFFDFIFPLFLFISGVSLSFSLNIKIEQNVLKKNLYKKAFKRMLILIFLGIIYKNAPVSLFEPSTIRFGSILGRIGIATFFTTLIYLNYNKIQRLYWIATILIIYYLALLYIRVPGFGIGDLSFEGNIVGWIDRQVMPGRLKQGTFDELAIATQLPALCLTLLGSFAGEILGANNYSPKYKTMTLVIVGVLTLTIGLIWGLSFPIFKKLWTSSFILVTGGMSFLILAVFYWIIDVKGYNKWAFFFKVIGMNSLVIYFAYKFIDFNYTSNKLFGGILNPIDEKWHAAILSFGALGLVWLFLYILYRNKIFVKI